MVLSRDEVLHVARLARLTLKEEEVDLFTRQLNDILSYMAQLREVDTEGVPPMAHALTAFNVFREDEVTPGLPREAALANAPDREEGGFVVPRVI
jgi:aspartyl-tRNA(Asn)/glutamyl-tRNA(Gln) amidotransferase subunit C|uniref:Aspartyl/glutamyl-tRNA(Asn/Gln) amidotransferase subunit C n=1 Tax=Desulfobacca acetoxidans TaxID=60893 RepID=A0A7C5ENK5_9BACT